MVCVLQLRPVKLKLSIRSVSLRWYQINVKIPIQLKQEDEYEKEHSQEPGNYYGEVEGQAVPEAEVEDPAQYYGTEAESTQEEYPQAGSKVQDPSYEELPAQEEGHAFKRVSTLVV